MGSRVNFSWVSTLLSGLVVFAATLGQAQIISPHGIEVEFSYTSTVEYPLDAEEETDEDRADLHARHMFGLFHSPKLGDDYNIDHEKSEGIGAPRSQMNIQILNSEELADRVVVTYANSGKMILHKKAAKKILKKGFLDLPLPNNPYAIYDKKCTDPHYTGFGDFWYFYDPFREGCEHLSKEPMATKVRLTITPATTEKLDLTPKLPFLRGDNGNGDLFLIYAIHGFAEDKTAEDPGRINYKELNQYLLDSGFTETREHQSKVIPMYVYRKDLRLANGKKIKVELRHLLVETSIGSRSKTFAKFFKEAIETADIIFYGGHSGLGGNLDIPSLEEKAGAFNFNKKKKQVFFFESCASYSYYLEHFSVEKTKAKIDILSNGLSSYFHTSNAWVSKFFDFMFDEENLDPSWDEILNGMEKQLEGSTYLLNVGGV